MESSVISGMPIFLALLLNGYGIQDSIKTSLPIIFGSFSGFILNDIYDYEKDMSNHPERPIPNNDLSLTYAVCLYIISSVAFFVFVYYFSSKQYIFSYVIFYVLLINYNHIVSFFPYLKSLFIAICSVVPMYVIFSFVSNEFSIEITCSIVLFLFGRELLMDVLDQKGDGLTLPNILGSMETSLLAFLAQSLGILLLLFCAKTIVEFLSVITIIFILCIFFLFWFRGQYRRTVIGLMRYQALCALPFLIN
jgi:4-hydroxybenzoate polyprenyltransferase